MTDKNNKSEYGLNRGNLKMIALFCMTLDHFAVMILDSWLKILAKESLEYFCVNTLHIMLRLIGRIAFPIFCFFIVEGLLYTRNVYKYALRLLILGIISEVPFDMVLKHTFFDRHNQNVFWTLLLGLITIYAIDGIYKKVKCKKAIRYIIVTITALSGMYLAEFFGTDYGIVGVLTIIIIYLIGREEYVFSVVLNILGQAYKVTTFERGKTFIVELVIYILFITTFSIVIYFSKRVNNINAKKMLAGVAALSGINPMEMAALINVRLFAMYNGEKGKNIGWLFYFYYPLHLAALAGLCMLVKLY